ncbi:MAG TPA: hypothetical protein EYO46_00060 [Candidatus Lambdaproteobacteria bacterium]|nr:hypothetical protein [Deltaproteobacteria bacterium]HHZ77609.1 hypothetical protein [Candidatus Lambdaproteobacteria bacterium]HIB44636.1 hypothetical protein [Candidatus Lambdaproteobacteria bacterium]HIB94126.1 hypothetical protein [Candidatus Lambdaproteobacteria bacterium]HIN49007.1 hypothetical protein [Deltaproteobacteria bacterium]
MHRITGVGGKEFVFIKNLDRVTLGELAVQNFKVEIGTMDYGFPIDGILGLDFLSEVGAIIDLKEFEIHI